MVNASLELRQGQQLVMTSQLRQSIHLLQLSTTELNEVIESELEKNPLLKREGDAELETEGRQSVENLVAAVDHPAVGVEVQAQPEQEREDSAWNLATERNEQDIDGAYLSRHERGSHTDELEQRVTTSQSLPEALMEQLRMHIHHPLEEKIAEVLVDMVDANGYLPADVEERASSLGIGHEMLYEMITLLQACEPTGIGARSLKECLRLQLLEREQLNNAMERLLDHLDWLAEGKLKQLCKYCDLSAEELQHYVQLIKACNPRPGSIYDTTIVETLVPEVLVRRGQQQEWVVELNQDTLPKLLIDRTYSNRIRESARVRSDLKLINEHLANANWLMKALHQRNTTLLRVATEIVKLQQDFFDFGIQYLKPMTLREIATNAECHESTVSRITTSKFLSCDRGIFELKYFFTSTLNNANGGTAYSSRTVMHLIKKMTDEESPDNILSDDAITEALNRQGIDVARRTVVKYRKQVGIPSSIERRRIKKAYVS